VTYKAAVSLDGRTATTAGESQWISSPESRRLVHEWRACAGAVAVGSGTAIHDQPQLTARDVDPPAERQPLRVVFDRGGRIDPAAWDGVVARGDAGEELAALAARGVTSVLVEGGATLAAGLLEAGLIDRVALFVAPLVLGDGPGPFAGRAVGSLAEAPAAVHLEARLVGPDILLLAELREV
jgi:diaminohydroxyphosphoribosylaminopyrimidine deaminase/5-amino-6-(5-phosphoribosylamino)uracil reductase